ncbi:hypothetical protein PMm318_A10690 [Pseudomonas moorei]
MLSGNLGAILAGVLIWGKLHLECGWTCLRVTRQTQTEGYDGVFHREFVVRKGHPGEISD